MDPILEWGLDLITEIQQFHGPVLDDVFRIITFLGTEMFYLLLLPLLIWCVDFRLGGRVAIFLLLSSYMNSNLKDLFCQPRPFQIDPTVKLSDAWGCGLPSGHAQSSVIVWGSLAIWMRRPWFWILALGLMFVIGFSRIYLGVHFPTDVLAGWMIGTLLLGLYSVTHLRVERWLAGLRFGTGVTLALAVPLVLLFPHPTRHTTSTLASLAGFGVGLVLTKQYISFSPSGPFWQRVSRFLVGGTIILALYFGLKILFPGEESALYLVFHFTRYFSIGIWAGFGGPWLFRRLRLAPARKKMN